MDGAWALYEAWLKILTGEAEIALAYGFGKSSAGHLRRVLALQLDPYLVAPLWPDSVSIAALQARLGIEAGLWSQRTWPPWRRGPDGIAIAEPAALASAASPPDDLLASPYVADPLRAHDCAPVTDGAAVVILAAGDRARELCERPAWITGFEHRIDSAVARRPRPDRLAVGCQRRPGRRRQPGPGRRAARAVHAPGADPAPGARPRRGRRRSARRAARCAATRCSPPAWPGSAARRPRSSRAAPTSRSGTRPAGPPCSRTWCAACLRDQRARPACEGDERRVR